jgi:hypothetical protein
MSPLHGYGRDRGASLVDEARQYVARAQQRRRRENVVG